MKCGATNPASVCGEQNAPQERKSSGNGNIRRDAEIESIKRTLYNAIDKLEKIQRREAELITT